MCRLLFDQYEWFQMIPAINMTDKQPFAALTA